LVPVAAALAGGFGGAIVGSKVGEMAGKFTKVAGEELLKGTTGIAKAGIRAGGKALKRLNPFHW